MGQADFVLSDSGDGAEFFAPCAVLGQEGLWAVWQGYLQKGERIFARFCDRKGLSPTEGITPEPGRCHAPFVGLVGGEPAAVWIDGSDGGRRVLSSVRRSSTWGPPAAVSAQEGVVSLHAAAGQDRLWAVWCRAEAPETFSIRAASFDGQTWTKAVRLTPIDAWVQRPQAAPAEGGCWVCWDVYDGLTFVVWAAFVGQDGTVSAPQQVSQPPAEEGKLTPHAWQFVPSMCVDAGGTPWVTWLCSQDVIDADGVVDQWPTVRAAWLDEDGWTPILDGAGCADLGLLAWGLLTWQDKGAWGYLGQRRRPMVVADPSGGVWLVWERKDISDRHTLLAGGVLCGRKLREGEAGAVRRLAEGPRGYAPAGIEENRLWAACRLDPDTSKEDVGLIACDLEGAPPLKEEGEWEDWRPILIREPRTTTRPRVQAPENSSQEYRLYWADPHVHTGLSTDAEGHVDELIAYARDKAGLDCVVLQDNDWYQLSLTPSEYDIYRAYVRHYHRDGAFVMLPAFEWTYILREWNRPRVATNPEYKKYICHRTVIGQDESFPLIRHSEVEGDPMDAITAHAEKHGALLHLHHERWPITDSPAETNVEVCSGWAAHMMDPEYLCKIHDLLASGRRLGFFGSSDNHRRNPGLGGGLTGIYAEAFTRSAILDALKRHRCFATDGSRIVLKFWVNGAFIGDETTTQEPPEIRWEVGSTAPPATVRLIRDGVCVRTWTARDTEASGSCVDRECTAGDHFYYLTVEQSTPWRHCPSNVAVARGPHAWSSPIWVTRTGRDHRRRR